MDAIREKLVTQYHDLERKYRRHALRFDRVITASSRALAHELTAARTLFETSSAYLHSQEHKSEFDVSEFKRILKQAAKSYKKLFMLTKPFWQQWIESIVIALIAVVLLRNFVFGLYHVPTGSAEPTLLVGDRVWGNNMAYLLGSKPEYGDLVMFYDQDHQYSSNRIVRAWQRYVGFGIPFLGIPTGPMNIVKRVIARPGDTIEGRIENGTPVLYRNGKKLDEPYKNPYPLILLNRKTGFIPLNAVFGLPIPSFLQKKANPVAYTYDPAVPYDMQPFYHMISSAVYHPGSDSPIDMMHMLSPDELRRVMNDRSTLYYLQTIRSGSGKVARNEQTGERIVIKDPRDPQPGYHGGRFADEFGPITLLPGYYWVMGDSRRNSHDSRFWGPLHESNIYGRASFVVYSIDSEEPFWLFELINHPIDFWCKSVRWNRFLKSMSHDNRIK